MAVILNRSESGRVPGSRYPIEYTDAVNFRLGTKTFTAYETEMGVMLAGRGAKYKGFFVVQPTLEEAIKQFLDDEEKGLFL